MNNICDSDQGIQDLQKKIRDLEMKLSTLQVTLAATQSNVSEANQRARQAEQMVGLLQSHADPQQVAQLVIQHMDQRSSDRSVHQQALIQATSVSLGTALRGSDEELRSVVNTVVKGLTTALGTMHQLDIQENEQRKQHHLTRRSSIDG